MLIMQEHIGMVFFYRCFIMRKSSSYILLCALCSINVIAAADTERQSLIINPGDQFNAHPQLTEKKGCFSCFGKRKQQPVQYHIQNNVLINMVHHKPQTEVVSYTGIVHEPIKSKFVVLNTMMPQSPSQPSQKDDEKQKKAELETIIHQDKSDQNSKPFIRRAHSTFNKSVQQDKTDKNQKSSIKRSNSTFIQPVQVSEDLQTELKEQDLLHLSAIQQVETFTLCPTDFEAKEITQLKEGISNLELKLQSLIEQQNNQSHSQMKNDAQVNHELQTQITILLSNFQQMEQELSSIKVREQAGLIQSLQQKLNQVEDKVKKNQQDQAEVNQSFQQQLTQVGEKVSGVKDNVEKVSDRVEIVESTIQQLEQQKQVATVEPQVITQQVEDPRVTQLSTELKQLQEKFGETVTRLEGKIGSGKNGIQSDIHPDTDDIISRISNLEKQLTNFKQAISKQCDDSKYTANRAQEKNSKLDQRVDALAKQISELGTNIRAIANTTIK